MASAEACTVSKQLASTSFRTQLLGKLLVQRWRGSNGNVRLSHPLMGFLLDNDNLSVFLLIVIRHQTVISR